MGDAVTDECALGLRRNLRLSSSDMKFLLKTVGADNIFSQSVTIVSCRMATHRFADP